MSRINVSNPKFLVFIGVTVAGIVVIAEIARRRKRFKVCAKDDFGAFIHRFELFPFPQPPPPAPRHLLFGLTFAVQDNFDVEDYVAGFGNPQWQKTHEVAGKTATSVVTLLKNGATCVGKTVMDEFSFGTTGQNVHYGTPINPQMPSHIPGGSSSGSAVAVAGKLVDFSIGTDTTGDVRIPAAFCGVIGFRTSQGAVSLAGVSPNCQSLDAVGWFARDPSILHLVGRVLLQPNSSVYKRERHFIFADDLFQFSKVPTWKSMGVVSKVSENLSGYKPSKHVNFGLHLFSTVPSLKSFREQFLNLHNGISTLKALSSVMTSLQRYEFKTNHEEWVKCVNPRLGFEISHRVLAANHSTHENCKMLYKVRGEVRASLHSLLKEDGILVIPTMADPPPQLASKKRLSDEYYDRAFSLLCIASMSGCCQITIPLGTHDEFPVSVSFIAFHGGDRFLLDTVLDVYSSLQEQARIVSNFLPIPDVVGNMETSELLKEKGNAAFKGRQWNKAVNFYNEAIKLNGTIATYYSNRAAAYLELGCFQHAEDDCCKAISLDKKNVKAYLRRGTARESLLHYNTAIQDFRHALVLEPQNKTASLAEKRLSKIMIRGSLSANA